MSADTVARVYKPNIDGMVVSSGPCKFPYARLGDTNKIHRTTQVILRWRLPEKYAHLEPVSIGIKCRLGFSASHPRLQLLTPADVPDDPSSFCSMCFGVRLPRCVIPPSVVPTEVAA